MTFVPSFSVIVIAIGVLILLGVADWYVSVLSIDSKPARYPGKWQPGYLRERQADRKAHQFKNVA